MVDSDTSSVKQMSSPAIVRMAVAQLDFHPAFSGGLDTPQWDLKSGPFLSSQVVSESLVNEAKSLRQRVRVQYTEQFWKKLECVVRSCLDWGVQVLVLPEYSVPPELLAQLAQLAPGILIFAGTHHVDRKARENLRRLGVTALPELGSAVCPVLFDGNVLATVPKLSRSEPETSWLKEGNAKTWGVLGVSKLLGTSVGTLICLDFLRGQREVGPSEEARSKCRWLAVPSMTSLASLKEFDAEFQKEAKRYRRPVLFANRADVGGSTIVTDLNRGAALAVQVPSSLQAGEEGLLVGDVNIGFERTGGHTQYESHPLWKPFAVASLVYPGRDSKYESWWRKASNCLGLGEGVETSQSELEDKEERQLAALEQHVETFNVPESSLKGARGERLKTLRMEVPAQKGDAEVLLREVVLTPDVLCLQNLQSALAGGAADCLDEWANRGGGSRKGRLMLFLMQSRVGYGDFVEMRRTARSFGVMDIEIVLSR